MNRPTTAALLPLLFAAGCIGIPHTPRKMPVAAYFAAEKELQRVHRVMVLPFTSAPGVLADRRVLRSCFVAELAKLQRFELVPLPEGAEEDAKLYQSLRRGRISNKALATLGERYNLDGVLLGTVTGNRSYKPPHLGLRVQLMSLHSATAIWAAEVLYDAADAATVEDLQHFAKSYAAPEDSMHGWELILISPTRFATFVSHRVVGTWLRKRSWI